MIATELIATILISATVAAVVSKEIAAHHFKVIDSYVKDMIALAKKYMADAYTNRDKR